MWNAYRLKLTLLGLVISVLCHLLIFEIFTFKITPIKESYKPKMTFLGPILSSHEFIDVDSSSEKTLAPVDIGISSITADKQGPARSTFSDLPNKQIFLNPQDITAKDLIKSTFPDEIPEKFRDPGMQNNTSPTNTYKPLKLDTHD